MNRRSISGFLRLDLDFYSEVLLLIGHWIIHPHFRYLCDPCNISAY
jgi:hypothetical protein